MSEPNANGTASARFTPREVAHRVFAAEYNASTVEMKGGDERSPAYVLTPLGAKVNRLFIVGVLTDVENVSEKSEFWRGRVSDPTGVFTIYSGQYQPEATAVLSKIETPAYVAIVGKCRTYKPEDSDQVYVSVSPESIALVDEATRDLWVLETARQTTRRLGAMKEATKLEDPSPAALANLGFPAPVAEGASLAIERYGQADFARYAELVSESLGYLKPGVEVPVHRIEATKPQLAQAQAGGGATVTVPAGNEEIENLILGEVERLAANDDSGAGWDEIVAKGTDAGHSDEEVEESLNALMDKGLIYEPVLGKLKLT